MKDPRRVRPAVAFAFGTVVQDGQAFIEGDDGAADYRLDALFLPSGIPADDNRGGRLLFPRSAARLTRPRDRLYVRQKDPSFPDLEVPGDTGNPTRDPQADGFAREVLGRRIELFADPD